MNLPVDIPAYVPVIAGAIVLLLLLQRVPVLGGVIRLLMTFALVAVVVIVIAERASVDPLLARLTGAFKLDGQEVVGEELRIRMGADGHFRAKASINGVERRMLVDTGATLTAISEGTAAAAGLSPKAGLVPVILQTANGMVQAQTATVREIRLGNIVARDLKVVVSPAFGDMDVIGMNLLSKLKTWRVEDGSLILVPHHPQKPPTIGTG